MPALLSMAGIVKRFGDVLAADGVDLEVRAGEIHALLGENGAGKTTLMNILYGLVRPDGGTIELGGHAIRPASPAAALDAGVGMVHQHPLLVDALTVAENLCLGGVGDASADGMRAALVEVERTLPLGLEPGERVGSLPLSKRQRLEIVRCLARRVDLLVLDEPTAVLTPPEVETLFAEMRTLAGHGRGVVFITHKLAEVEAIADRVTVLRGGRRVCSGAAGEFSRAALTEAMVGRSLPGLPELPAAERGPARLEIDACTCLDRFGRPELDCVAFDVHAGEIVCIAGVEGNGQRSLADLLFGLTAPQAGAVRYEGRVVPPAQQWRGAGIDIARIPEERRTEGLLLDAPLWRNLLTGPMAPAQPLLLRRRELIAWAGARLEEFDVRPPDPLTPASALSGGNQQKVVLSRELGGHPGAVVAVNPTRGLDLGAQAEVHGRLLALRAQGIALLVVSTDLEEVERLADRVGVLYRGVLHGPYPREALSRKRLGALMAGLSDPVPAGAGA